LQYLEEYEMKTRAETLLQINHHPMMMTASRLVVERAPFRLLKNYGKDRFG
jgi:hypothetical protein